MIGATRIGLRSGGLGLSLLALAAVGGCESMDDYDGGLLDPFPEGVVSQARDDGAAQTPASDDPTAETPAAPPRETEPPLVRDTGGPPAVTAGGAADGAGAEPAPLAASADGDAAVAASPTADPVPSPVDQPAATVATGTPALPPIAGGGAIGAPAAPPADPTVVGAGIAPVDPVATPVEAAPVATSPITPEPALAGTEPPPPTVAAPTWSGPTPTAASCGPNALAVSAPLAQIELVSVFPAVAPPSAIVRFPAGTEAMVTVGDILGEEGGKVVVVGPDHIEVTVLSVGTADTLTMATHTLSLTR